MHNEWRTMEWFRARRRCATCDDYKLPTPKFWHRYHGGLNRHCKDCRNEKRREERAKLSPELRSKLKRARRFGRGLLLTPEEVKMILREVV